MAIESHYDWQRWGRSSTKRARRDRYRAIFQFELAEKAEAGEVDPHDYAKAIHASDQDHVMDHLIHESENPSAENGFTVALDWATIWDWIKTHWVDILKLVLFVLFLEPKPEGPAHG